MHDEGNNNNSKKKKLVLHRCSEWAVSYFPYGISRELADVTIEMSHRGS